MLRIRCVECLLQGRICRGKPYHIWENHPYDDIDPAHWITFAEIDPGADAKDGEDMKDRHHFLPSLGTISLLLLFLFAARLSDCPKFGLPKFSTTSLSLLIRLMISFNEIRLLMVSTPYFVVFDPVDLFPLSGPPEN